MNDYQAIYDAVRSRMGNCDVGAAIEQAMRDANLSHHVECAAAAIAYDAGCAAADYRRPSAIYRPAISIDGNQWCALYGANLQDGVAGFGDSPADAMRDFDKAWSAALARTEGAGPEVKS